MTEIEAWARAAEWFDRPPAAGFLRDAATADTPPDLILYLAPFYTTPRAPVRFGEALQAYSNAVLAESVQRHTALALSEALGREGIPHAFLKGGDFRHRLYPEPALRAISDLDVWVPPARAERAVRVLRTLAASTAKPSDLEAFLRGSLHECSWTLEGVGVDLHSGLLQPGRGSIDAAEWIGRAGEIRLEGGTLPVLDREGAFAVALVHAGVHEGVPEYVHFKHGLDVALALARWPDLEWETIHQRTVSGRCRRLAGAALWSFLPLLGDRLPGRALALLDPGGTARWLAARTRRLWPTERGRPGPEARAGQLLRKFVFAEGFRERRWLVKEWLRRRGSMAPAARN